MALNALSLFNQRPSPASTTTLTGLTIYIKNFVVKDFVMFILKGVTGNEILFNLQTKEPSLIFMVDSF